MTSETSSATVRQILTIIAVDNLESSGRFYDEVFGWERRIDAPVYIEYQLPGGQGLGVYQRANFANNTGQIPIPTPPAPGTTSTELYFHVDAPEISIDRLKRVGARELSPLQMRDWGDEAAYYADPDNNVIVIARLR